MKGTFSGIGVGPGDPELITLKAVHRLQQVDMVIAPRTGNGVKSTALQIAQPHLKEQTEILELTFPMVYDEQKLSEAWVNNQQIILQHLDQGKNIAFLTLGDPMLYSTYLYVLRLLREHSIHIQTIPGITSFCAAASRANLPLAEMEEIVAVIPATCAPAKLQQALAVADNVVLMKVSKNTPAVIQALQGQGFTHSVMVSKCGHSDEEVYFDLQDPEIKATYLSTILAKKLDRRG